MPTLVIANKTYSSWSLRPWLLMRQLGVAFDEVMIPLDLPDTKSRVRKYSPAGKVPVLIDGDVTVWESVHHGICRERFWHRCVAGRSQCSRDGAFGCGRNAFRVFGSLRAACPMNLGKKYRSGIVVPASLPTWHASAKSSHARDSFGEAGPFLFGSFGAADAMFAPLVTRLDTYSIDSGRTHGRMWMRSCRCTPLGNGEMPPCRKNGLWITTKWTKSPPKCTATIA